MKIVLDTNVLISGIFFSGPPFEILTAWRNSELQIVLTQEILEEYQRVAESLADQYPTVDILPILELMTIHGQVINTEGVDVAICEDRDDDKFVECAIAGHCKIIISGDKHLLKISGYQEITVLKPKAFVDRYLK